MEKVFLRIETPFSLKNAYTRKMVWTIVSLPVMMLALVVYLHLTPNMQDLAGRMTLVFVIWFVMGAIPCTLLILNSYARICDEELVVNSFGFFEKHYPLDSLQKAAKSGQRIAIYANGKPIVSMPDNPAARNLVRRLRIHTEFDMECV